MPECHSESGTQALGTRAECPASALLVEDDETARGARALKGNPHWHWQWHGDCAPRDAILLNAVDASDRHPGRAELPFGGDEASLLQLEALVTASSGFAGRLLSGVRMDVVC